MRRGTLIGAGVALAAASPARAEEAGPPPPPALETIVSARAEPSSAPREDRSAAASVVIPGDSPRAYDDLGSMLLEVPGVTVTRTGAVSAFASLRLRGSDPDQVRIYLDGVPLNIAAGGAVDVSTLPLGDVERVEVYRGSSPLAFGESALGGIISITTRTPGAPLAMARAATGSFGTEVGDVAVGGRAGRVRLYFGAHGLRSTGDYPFHNDNGTPLNPADDTDVRRQNDDVSEANGVFRGALTLSGRRTLSLGLVGFGRDQGLPGPELDPTVYARFRSVRGLGYARYESRDDLGPGGRLAVEAFGSAERDHFIDRFGEIGGGPAQSHSLASSAGVIANASRPFGDHLRAAAVLEGRRETFSAFDELAGAPSGLPGRRLGGVAGGELDLRSQRLDLDVIPSARLEAMSDVVSGSAVGATGAPISRLLPIFRLGLVRPLTTQATFKANLGRYARAPSFIELYGNGTGRLVGNPNLDPEHGTNADLGLWFDRPGERVGLVERTTAFGALVDDLIRWDNSPWGQARAENLARARIYGLEEELRVALGRRVLLTGQATYLQATDDSDSAATRGCPIPFLPRYNAYARPELRHLRLPGGLELGAYLDGDLTAVNYRTGACIGRSPTRVLLGAGLSISAPGSRLRLTASGANLTDIHPYDVPNWPLAGRLVIVALAYTPIGAGEDAEAGGSGSSAAW